MNLDTRKLLVIQDFLRIQNEEIVSDFEKLLQQRKVEQYENDLKPMSMEELNRRIDRSLKDSKEGRLTESSKLISQIEKWS